MVLIRRIPAILLLVLALALIPCPPGACAQEGLQPERGLFLVASRQIQDHLFRQSVVLLLSVEPDGVVGLIINKPSVLNLTGLFPKMRKPSRNSDHVYFGGPVAPRSVLVLHRMRRASENLLLVLKEVYVSSDQDVLERTLRKKRAGDDYRVFMGYAGWMKGQLERELRRGDWHVVEADAEAVFHKDADNVWPSLIRKGEEIIVWETDMDRWLLDRHLAWRDAD